MRRALLLVVVALAGCGSSGGSDGPVVVSAATSLKAALTRYGDHVPGGARLSFAGSDELAAQIRAGARPDVFASANTKLPDQLYAEKLVERPRVFAANRLVLAVPASGGSVSSLADAAKPGVKVVMGAKDVPVGAYTRTVLGKLPPTQSLAILRNVRSEEPDVGGVVGKLAQGAADAGFVYVTDVRAASGKLRAIELPASLQPRVRYGVAVVRGAKHAAAARDFVAGLLAGQGAQDLRAAGFEKP
jgi:molybdate transport system substrate-binding protein